MSSAIKNCSLDGKLILDQFTRNRLVQYYDAHGDAIDY